MADWKEFVVDKGADFIIAFTGLYLAIGVQGWWDDRKDHEAYVQSLEAFKTELAYDKAQTVDTSPISQAIDDLAVLSIYYQTEAQIFSEYDDPAQVNEVMTQIDELNEALDAAVATKPGATLNDLLERSAVIKPAKLTPHYETQIWKVYLAGGVKTAQENAKNQDLSREIGALYKELDSVEQRTRELETFYNERFLPRFAEIHAASEPLESYWYDDETGNPLEDAPLLEKLTTNQPDIAEAATDLDLQLTENYVELQVASTMLQAKIDDLVAPETGLLAKVAVRVDTVTALIDEELAAVKK
ncbi:hypothetical protein ACNOYE_00405 [Nannocystaceae bacterium ST9]